MFFVPSWLNYLLGPEGCSDLASQGFPFRSGNQLITSPSNISLLVLQEEITNSKEIKQKRCESYLLGKADADIKCLNTRTVSFNTHINELQVCLIRLKLKKGTSHRISLAVPVPFFIPILLFNYQIIYFSRHSTCWSLIIYFLGGLSIFGKISPLPGLLGGMLLHLLLGKEKHRLDGIEASL